MKKIKLVLIGIGLLICAIIVVLNNHKEKLPTCESVPVQESDIDLYELKYEWVPPYPLGI